MIKWGRKRERYTEEVKDFCQQDCIIHALAQTAAGSCTACLWTFITKGCQCTVEDSQRHRAKPHTKAPYRDYHVVEGGKTALSALQWHSIGHGRERVNRKGSLLQPQEARVHQKTHVFTDDTSCSLPLLLKIKWKQGWSKIKIIPGTESEKYQIP